MQLIDLIKVILESIYIGLFHKPLIGIHKCTFMKLQNDFRYVNNTLYFCKVYKFTKDERKNQKIYGIAGAFIL